MFEQVPLLFTHEKVVEEVPVDEVNTVEKATARHVLYIATNVLDTFNITKYIGYTMFSNLIFCPSHQNKVRSN